LKIKQPKKNNK